MFLTSGVRRILAYREPVDMRKSFDGLVSVVTHRLKEDPLSGSLFVFVNRRGSHVKLVYWDRTGYCLFAKRLEQGRFRFPGTGTRVELCEVSLRLILDGIVLGGRRRDRVEGRHDVRIAREPTESSRDGRGSARAR
jgi:transposase